MKQIRNILGKQLKRNSLGRIIYADNDTDYIAKCNALVDFG